MFLLVGDDVLTDSELRATNDEGRDTMLLVSIFGVFLMLACAVSVFNSVLADSYDIEQERMLSTFLRERARICSGFYLRPSLRIVRVVQWLAVSGCIWPYTS